MHQGRDQGGDLVQSRVFNNGTQPEYSSLVKTFAKKAWDSPKVKLGLVLWVLGIGFMVFAPAPVKVSPEMADKYDEMMYKAKNLFEVQDALHDLAQAQSVLYDSQVWFWRWSSDDVRNKVYKNQEIVAQKQAVVDALEAKRAEMTREANAYVGIWSEYGFSEVRERFWGAFESGKVFATRQTFWQMFYSLLSSREEHFLSVLLQWVVTALLNFTLGLLGSLFYFIFSLASMVYSYQPDPLSAVAFYVLSFIGGASLVATYLAGIYGVAAGGIFVVGKVLLNNAIEYRQRQERLTRGRGRHEHND